MLSFSVINICSSTWRKTSSKLSIWPLEPKVARLPERKWQYLVKIKVQHQTYHQLRKRVAEHAQLLSPQRSVLIALNQVPQQLAAHKVTLANSAQNRKRLNAPVCCWNPKPCSTPHAQWTMPRHVVDPNLKLSKPLLTSPLIALLLLTKKESQRMMHVPIMFRCQRRLTYPEKCTSCLESPKRSKFTLEAVKIQRLLRIFLQPKAGDLTKFSVMNLQKLASNTNLTSWVVRSC